MSSIKNKLLPPGSLVVCRPDSDQLILWESYGCDVDDIKGMANVNDILIVLEAKENSSFKDERLTEEWLLGAYKIMTPEGIQGWTGAGWVVPITT